MSKPEIGLTPRTLWNEQRREAIEQAIERYKNANMLIPLDWAIEYAHLLNQHDGLISPSESKLAKQLTIAINALDCVVMFEGDNNTRTLAVAKQAINEIIQVEDDYAKYIKTIRVSEE